MTRRSLPVFLLLACASAARADDALLPTHLVEGGQVFATATARYGGGKGDATVFGSKGDFDQSIFQLQLDAGIGLGMGFEVDASIYYQFVGDTHADFAAAGVEFDSVSRGFSDLALEGRYGILKDSKVLPQLVVGAIVVAPAGNDKPGQTGTKVGGVSTSTKEEAGIGQGVWHYGFEAGLSKNLVVVEPYLATSYVFGDKRTVNGIHEDRADVWNLVVGARWYVTPLAALDTRAVFSRPGVDKTENNGSQVKEEPHFTYTGQLTLQSQLAPAVTFLAGGGVVFVEDHEVNDLVQLNLKDD
ncbi:MAG: hypothetical protein HY293_15315 [Planctomycetes bacterium]|nr:hypothetical protein [Planctomycetota bacterium]